MVHRRQLRGAEFVHAAFVGKRDNSIVRTG